MCQHKNTQTVLEGRQRFVGGEYDDNIVEKVFCLDCGSEIDQGQPDPENTEIQFV